MKQAKQALENECGDTFVFCPSFYHQLRAIKSIETRLMVYEAVVEYGVLGKVPDFSKVDPLGLIDGIFAAIKYVIDSTKLKRVHISNERSKAGKNGGAPKGNQNARKQPKTSKTNKTSVDVDVDENIKKPSIEGKESADKPRRVASKRPAFVAPSLEIVKDYFSTIEGTPTDAECFYDYFTANGWRTGKNPIKDWKAAARNWMRRKSEFSNTPQNQTTTQTNHETKRIYKDL
ncbi:DUF6291 domain-containing protein [Alistipes finegoldii]|uniref:DUF6291 domain-containing protein n=1 Tax=Alistipes finegoldii TaxID=214856 RepID=UPI00248C8EE5|nr:DUF6291 domain-containing protein [Alistipes finegoldii]